MKLKIVARAPDDQPPYENLRPLIEALLEDGNAFAKPLGGHIPDRAGFYLDRDGWVCDLREPIDFDLLEKRFDMPSSIRTNRPNSTICDDLSWVQIRGGIK